MSKNRIAIFGGGVSGLTVAHECIEAGLEVHLYERDMRYGGRAMGYRIPKPHAWAGVPIEHSIRTYQSTYNSFFETLHRIPYYGLGPQHGKTVFDNLKPLPYWITSILKKNPKGDYHVVKSSELPTLVKNNPLTRAYNYFHSMKDYGVPSDEILKFMALVFKYIVSSDERRKDIMTHDTFFSYANFSNRSESYQEYLTSISELLVAAKSDASASLVMEIFSRLMMGARINPFGMEATSSVLNGPTSERLIDPWVAHLQRMGVHFHPRSELAALKFSAEKGPDRSIKKVILQDGQEVNADAFVLAIPHQALKSLMPEFYYSSTLQYIQTSWANGFQFFLKKVPERMLQKEAFNFILGSPWRAVFILEAAPLWEAVELPHGIQGILSVTVCNMETPGIVHKKTFKECTWPEIQDEIFAQIGLEERDLVMGAHLDPMLKYVTEENYLKHQHGLYRDSEAGPLQPNGHLWVNRGPLSILNPKVLQHRMLPNTPYRNLFLAGEYVDAFMMLPTMEKANESGKSCAYEVHQYFDVDYDTARLQPPAIPLEWARQVDSVIYKMTKTTKGWAQGLFH